LNQYTKALYAFEEYLKIRPDDEVVFKKIGTVYSKMGGEAAAANRIPEAEAYLLKAIEHDPDLHECYVNLGNIAAMKQDFATAESRYNTALQINPENSGTWFNLGLMRLQSGNQGAGLEAIRKAASLGNQQAGQWLSQFTPQP
jgi:tetratricopeptide (TPR) repeat protein